ncbi:hypothetical protein HPB50_024205 [Hyalomma asiaticum]|uniref:Uncharacterized protein n=1 Tax=Hyalomma asiaticum TaxID=266040 RepID=A0ACB7SWA8_HYAAI|nr:hypothetical protein HPB50_024205 [Hyalomma asiaticum]
MNTGDKTKTGKQERRCTEAETPNNEAKSAALSSLTTKQKLRHTGFSPENITAGSVLQAPTRRRRSVGLARHTVRRSNRCGTVINGSCCCCCSPCGKANLPGLLAERASWIPKLTTLVFAPFHCSQHSSEAGRSAITVLRVGRDRKCGASSSSLPATAAGSAASAQR